MATMVIKCYLAELYWIRFVQLNGAANIAHKVIYMVTGLLAGWLIGRLTGLYKWLWLDGCRTCVALETPFVLLIMRYCYLTLQKHSRGNINYAYK